MAHFFPILYNGNKTHFVLDTPELPAKDLKAHINNLFTDIKYSDINISMELDKQVHPIDDNELIDNNMKLILNLNNDPSLPEYLAQTTNLDL